MILVDTCGWLEYLRESELAASYEPYFQKKHELLVPVVVQYELFKWFSREQGPEIAKIVMACSYQGVVVPMTTEVALLAAELSLQHKLAMADAMILASAQSHHAELITSDAHFQGISGVRFLSKKTD